MVLCAVMLAVSPITLDGVLRDVRVNAPARQVQAAGVDVARAEVGMAGAWEDPILGARAEEISTDPEMQGQPLVTWSFDQPLNLFGRRRLAKDAARARLDVASQALRRAEWDAQGSAVALFHEIWMADEMARVLRNQIAVLEAMRDAAMSRYAAGFMMAHHDVLRADAEHAAMSAELESVLAERAGMVAMLNTLRGLPANEPVESVELPERAAIGSAEDALSRVDGTPEVSAADAMTREAEARRGLARRLYLPMVMAGVMVEQAPGDMGTTVGGEVRITVPLWGWDRQRNEVRTADAMVRAARVERRAMRSMSEAEIRMAWARADAADRALRAIEDVALPRLRDAVASSEAAYRSGGDGFLSLLESIVALRELESRRLRAVVGREIARFELSRLTASALPLAPETP